MSELDGLFENPNQSPEQQSLDTLNAVKDDTGAIREAMYKFGGKQIDLMRSQQVQQKQQHKQSLKAQAQVVKSYRKQHIEKRTEVGHTENFAKNEAKQTAYKSQHSQPKVVVSEPQQATKNKSNEQIKQIAEAVKKPLKAELPNGWGYDKQGRIRDKFGKYVSQKELKKHGLENNNKEVETEKEASDRRLLEALSGIKDAVETPQDLDPTINAMQELAGPFKRIFDVGKVGVDAGRGMGKAFGDTVKHSRWRERFSGLFRKSLRDNDKQQNRMIHWLRKIWKKDANGSGGWLAKLLFFIPLLLRAFGTLTDRLKKFALFRGLLSLGKLFGKGFSRIFPPFGKLFGSFGKGLLKRLPIIGSLLAFNDGGMAGGIGSIIGGVLGSAFGPIGTIIGGLVGEKIGVWLAGLDWSSVGEWFKEKWQTITTAWEPISNWFKESWQTITAAWEPIGEWFKEKWEGITKFFTDIGNEIIGFFKDLLPESVVNAVSNTVDTVKEYGGKAVDMAKEYGGKAVDKVKELSGNASDWVSDKWNSVANWFSSDNVQTEQSPQTEENVTEIRNVSEKTGRLQTLLEDMKTTAGDTFNLLKDKLNNLAYPNGIDSSGMPITNVGNGVSGIVNTAVTIAKEATAAADYAINHAAGKSLGKCAKYVNDALRSQGIKIHGHGKDVAGNLLKSSQGFSEVQYDENYIPQIGDVMSMPSSSKSDHNYGHVAIYTEKGWVSDFKQGNKYGNTAAANVHYWNDIKSGRIKPTIARKGGNVATDAMNVAQAAAGYAQGYTAPGTIKGLNQIETAALMNQVISKESRGNLNAINSYGYLGLYQFGAAALADVGLIDRNKYDQAVAKYGKGISKGSNAQLHKSFLEDESNWTLAGGQNAFLSDRKAQDRAMLALLNKNANYLGDAYSGDSRHKAGLLMAAHLKGAGNAREFALKGKDSKDGYGTSVSSYYNAGYQAVKMATNTVTKLPSVTNTHAPIPKAPEVMVNNPIKIAEQALAQSEKNKKADTQKEAKNIENKISSPDPIMAFLTQDVSERRIAHIVTGGITRYA